MELLFRDDAMRVYIAGPYSKPDPLENMGIALRMAEHVWVRGDIPYVPHLTGFWQFAHPHPYGSWLALDMKWLQVCDGFLRFPGESPGADKEEARAKELGLCIWHGLEEYLKHRLWSRVSAAAGSNGGA